MSSSNDPSNVNIDGDYDKVYADLYAQQQLYTHYKDDLLAHFLTMFDEMKKGHKNPDLLINYFMYQMMPAILDKGQDKLSITGDQLNVLSDYRSLVSDSQSEFNQFNDGNIDPSDTTDAQYLTKALSDINDAIAYGQKLAKDLGYKSGGLVLDDGTSTQIGGSIKTLDSLVEAGGTSLGDITQYLDNLWPSASQPTDPGSGNYKNHQNAWVEGASETTKTIGEQYNTMNTGSSTLTQAKQTSLQYGSSSLQQFMGLDNNLLQNRAKQTSALVQNQKTS